eukprot:Pompholyxophrys_sp_v1_NODE_4_length_15125_cov_6.573656.p1 type:complete len:936 gc:universal NODE_4_length_15125_cov_6.573656:3679-6486(+)
MTDKCSNINSYAQECKDACTRYGPNCFACKYNTVTNVKTLYSPCLSNSVNCGVSIPNDNMCVYYRSTPVSSGLQITPAIPIVPYNVAYNDLTGNVTNSGIFGSGDFFHCQQSCTSNNCPAFTYDPATTTCKLFAYPYQGIVKKGAKSYGTSTSNIYMPQGNYSSSVNDFSGISVFSLSNVNSQSQCTQLCDSYGPYCNVALFNQSSKICTISDGSGNVVPNSNVIALGSNKYPYAPTTIYNQSTNDISGNISFTYQNVPNPTTCKGLCDIDSNCNIVTWSSNGICNSYSNETPKSNTTPILSFGKGSTEVMFPSIYTISNNNFTGSNILSQSNLINTSTCQVKCDKISNCNLAVWSSSNSDTNKQCTLMTGLTGSATMSSNFISFGKNNVIFSTIGNYISANSDYNCESNLITNAISPYTCQAKCDANSNCNLATWNTSSNTCQIKTCGVNSMPFINGVTTSYGKNSFNPNIPSMYGVVSNSSFINTNPSISQFITPNKSSCQSSCDNVSNCFVASWTPTNQSCTLYDGIGTAVTSSNTINYGKNGTMYGPALNLYTSTPNNYTGNPIGTFISPTSNVCQTTCDRTSNCNVTTWNSPTKTCNLYSGTDGFPTPSTNTTSFGKNIGSNLTYVNIPSNYTQTSNVSLSDILPFQGKLLNLQMAQAACDNNPQCYAVVNTSSGSVLSSGTSNVLSTPGTTMYEKNNIIFNTLVNPYSKTGNNSYTGTPVKSFTAPSSFACRSTCDITTNCNVVVWDSNNNKCTFLTGYDGQPIPGSNTSQTFGRSQNTYVNIPSNYTISKNNFSGGNIPINTTDIINPYMCMAACDANTNCNVAVWDSTSKCSLYDGTGTAVNGSALVMEKILCIMEYRVHIVILPMIILVLLYNPLLHLLVMYVKVLVIIHQIVMLPLGILLIKLVTFLQVLMVMLSPLIILLHMEN